MPGFRATVSLPAGTETALAWHRRPGAFERLTPPWTTVRLRERTGGIEPGARVVLEVGRGPLRFRWELVHDRPTPAEPGDVGFADEQRAGPFARWRHDHLFRDGPADGGGAGGSILDDRIAWEPPGGALGRALLTGRIERDLARMFAYRHRVLRDDLAAGPIAIGSAGPADRPPRVLVAGAGGLVGRRLVARLATGGCEVGRLARPASDRWGPGLGDAVTTVAWDASRGPADPAALEGWDAVVHLGGAGIADAPWTAARRRVLRSSRIDSTRVLATALAACDRPPAAFLVASAIGIYGPAPAGTVDERSPAGEGFLADLVRDWEAAADPARTAGIRTVHLRFGLVLAGGGGLLGKMLPAFRLGLGARLGDGRQGASWVALDDVLGACVHALRTPALDGPVNVVAPRAATNAELTRVLARVVRRPAPFSAPAFLLRAALGDLAREAMLSDQRVRPARLVETGYRFRFSGLEDALRHETGAASLPIAPLSTDG